MSDVGGKTAAIMQNSSEYREAQLEPTAEIMKLWKKVHSSMRSEFGRFTFDSFVVGKPNALAHAAARRVVESSAVPFNPLFIYGGVGLGKTHLMHAIAHSIQENWPEKTIMYLSAEKFMYQFVKALRANDTMNFKDQFRSVDVLMVDDIQFIAGKESTQEEFFHTFNALVDQNKQIIISADKAPGDLSGLDERLRSRLALVSCRRNAHSFRPMCQIVCLSSWH